jgi:hypothetical protein
VVFKCQDKDDPTLKAELTVDASFEFVWHIAGDEVSSTLVSVERLTDLDGYALHGTSGHFVSVDLGPDTSGAFMSGDEVTCDPKTIQVDRTSLDHLVATTDASRAKEQTFATCSDGSRHGRTTFTVRPDLGNTGALIEGTDADGDDFVLHATSATTPEEETVTYSGNGATTVVAAGQHISPFTEITTDETGEMSWDAAGDLAPAGGCTFDGETFAEGLVHAGS